MQTYICCFTSCFRLKLAALHFNENSNRPQAMTKKGVKQYDIVHPKYRLPCTQGSCKSYIWYASLILMSVLKDMFKLQVMLNSYYKRLLNNAEWEEAFSQMEKSLNHFVQHMSDQIKQLLYNNTRVALVLLSLC